VRLLPGKVLLARRMRWGNSISANARRCTAGAGAAHQMPGALAQAWIIPLYYQKPEKPLS
jgi:hypothetical protein